MVFSASAVGADLPRVLQESKFVRVAYCHFSLDGEEQWFNCGIYEGPHKEVYSAIYYNDELLVVKHLLPNGDWENVYVRPKPCRGVCVPA